MNDRRFLNWLIESLTGAYEENPNEKILLILKRIKAVKGQGEALEEEARNHELLEALNMIDELPHAQRTWLLHYRDKDME